MRERTQDALRQAVRGAVSGVVASTAMGGLILGLSKLGLMGEPPPRKLTRKMLRKVDPKLARGAPLAVVTGLAHVGYGAVFGAGFGALAANLPNRPARITAGVVFGGALWGVGYAGWIPALGLMRQPDHDFPPARPWGMIAAHLVYGALLGAMIPNAKSMAKEATGPRENEIESDELDRELDDSFPASDPPGITQPHRPREVTEPGRTPSR